MIGKKQTKAVGQRAAYKVKRFAAGHKQIAISLAVLAFGALVAFILIKLQKPPGRIEEESLAPLVKVRQLKLADIQMVVSGYGTVKPRVQVEIVPEVSGKVVYVNPQFKAGGFVAAGESLLEIDPRDYELAVQQAEAGVADAEVKLDLEKAEAQVARKEWEQLNPNTEPASPLVLRQPQIRQARAGLESAKARLATAKLNLERTRLSLPLDVRIMNEKVDLGQYVTTGGSIGSAYGIDAVEIELPVEDSELAWFDIPEEMVSFNGSRASTQAPIANVKADFAGAEHIWRGYITRTTGQIDTKSRLVSVVVEVPQPFDSSSGRPPLLPGIFVEVEIIGKVLKNAVAVPRDAIREGNKLWLVNNDRLHIQPLEIVRSDGGFAYVTSSVEDGAMMVVSSLDTVTDGMKVRTRFEDE